MSNAAELIFQQTPPKHLFHYSNAAGVLGIMASKVIWATSCRSMNDDHEIRHAVNVLTLSFQNHLRLRGLNDDIKVREISQHLSILGEKNLGHCIVSFSETGDLLSQWRAYGADGRGISIGFQSKLLKDDADQAGFTLGKCVYDYSLQYQICQSFWAKVLSEISLSSLESGLPQHLIDEIEDFIYTIGVFLKHPAFVDEQEWRIVSGKNYLYSDLWKYRAVNAGIAAYIDVPLLHLLSREPENASVDAVPYITFTLGPKVKSNPTAAILQSISYKITGKGYGIAISSVPYVD